MPRLTLVAALLIAAICSNVSAQEPVAVTEPMPIDVTPEAAVPEPVLIEPMVPAPAVPAPIQADLLVTPEELQTAMALVAGIADTNAGVQAACDVAALKVRLCAFI